MMNSLERRRAALLGTLLVPFHVFERLGTNAAVGAIYSAPIGAIR